MDFIIPAFLTIVTAATPLDTSLYSARKASREDLTPRHLFRPQHLTAGEIETAGE